MKHLMSIVTLCFVALSAVPEDSATAGGTKWDSWTPLAAAGSVWCDRKSPGACVVAWHFDDKQSASIHVEQFDPENLAWKRAYGPVTEFAGTTESPMPEGYLYRAVACETGKDSGCESSTAIWAPVHFGDAAEIPKTVVSQHGTVFSVSKGKDDSFEGQRQQFNAYLIYDLAERIDDWAAMPPITEPPIDPVAQSAPEWLWDDLIQDVAEGHFGPVNDDPAVH
jgi:hypothetical protein